MNAYENHPIKRRQLPRQAINRRAWALAQDEYVRFRDALEADVIDGGVSVAAISAWLPADRRGGDRPDVCTATG